ncbi:hypothetical protein [Candidatus Pelagibacter sp.]|uniref:hypothetical protein n=1 Tax=Candidatus Pelagibacter sp. TaxID=2024849 RepID=UPI003F85CF01
MIEIIKRKILTFLNIRDLKEKQNNILINQGKIFSKINLNQSHVDINDYEFKIFSQFGEDGIIQHIVNNIEVKNKSFVEFGVENYNEANTRFLLEAYNWKGLILDSSKQFIQNIKNENFYWKLNILANHAFVNCENINSILEENKFTGNIGLLSIDVDGNDYWIWKSINIIDPDIVIIEYNARYGKKKSITIPYDPNFVRGKNEHFLYFGASLKALVKLGKSKGYDLVCTNKNGNNAFFVKTNLLNDKIRAGEIDKKFHKNKFTETEDDFEFNFDSFKFEEV